MKVKSIICLMLFTISCMTAFAEDTDISTIDNVVYIESGLKVSIDDNGNVTIPIKMKNAVGATGYQFNIVLPSGLNSSNVTFKKSNVRKAEEVSYSGAYQADGSYKAVAYTGDDLEFDGNDGEIVIMTVANATEGDYVFTFKSSSITSHGASFKHDEEVVSTVTVGEDAPAYDEGYAITVAPFDIKPGQEYDEDIENTDNKVIVFKMQNAAEVSKVEFDVELPEGVSVGQIVVKKKYYDDVYFAGDYESEDDFPEIDDNDDGSKHLSAENNFSAVEKAAPIIKFAVTSEENVPEGVYTITIKNVEITTADGDVYDNIAPITSYVKVGAPKEQTIVIEGMLTEEIDNALANEECISTLDLTNVTQIEKTLTLVDGRSFIGPKKPVLAPEASYSRTMSNDWGTIMLPYVVESNSEAAYYLPSSIEDGTLKLTKQDELPANTPALVLRPNGATGIAAANTGVKVSSKDGNIIESGDVVMHGSFTNNTKVSDGNAYYIKNNQFRKCTSYFFIDAFRAYFTTESTSANSLSLEFEEDVNAINALVGVGDTTIEGYYDVAGKRLANLQNGVNIVKFSNGKTKKIIVE